MMQREAAAAVDCFMRVNELGFGRFIIDWLERIADDFERQGADVGDLRDMAAHLRKHYRFRGREGQR